jgi:hypothetical protein
MGITMAIEVQTQATIAQLASGQAPVTAEPVEPTAAAVTPQATEKESKEPVAKGGESSKDEKDKDSNPVQPRIDKLTRQRKEAEEFARNEYNLRMQSERRARELEEELSSFKAKAPQAQPREDAEPKPSDFKDAVEYTNALVDWKVKQKLNEREQQQQQQREADERNARIQTWNERQEAAKAEIDDYEDVVGAADVPIRPYLQEAIVESEIGPRLAYHFAKNPAELERLNKLSPDSALRELGKLETKFEKSSASSEPTPVEITKRATSPPVSRAPAPIEPIRSVSASQVSKDPAMLSFDDYRAQRKAGRIK